MKRMRESNDNADDDRTDRSDRSDPSDHSRQPIRASGGYRKLRSFQVATIVYDATFAFCERFVRR